MAEFIDTSQKEDTVTEADSGVPTNSEIRTDLLSDENGEEIESIQEDAVTVLLQQKNNLLRRTNELHEISINLLTQKLNLLVIKNDKSDDIFSSLLKGYMKYLYEIPRMFELLGITICLVQRKFKLIEMKNGKHDNLIDGMLEEHMNCLNEIQGALHVRERTVKVMENEKSSKDTDGIIEEAVDSFVKYLEAFKECVFFIDGVFQKVVEKQKNSYMKTRIKTLLDSVSILEECRTRCDEIQKSSERPPEERKSSLINDHEALECDLDKKINLLISVTEKVEITYIDMQSAVLELINIE